MRQSWSARLLVVLGIVGAAGAILLSRNLPLENSNASGPLPPARASENAEIHSSDGTMKLVTKTTKNANSSSMYSFTVSAIDGSDPHMIYATSASPSATLAIPYNSWSPDNKIVFIEKKSTDGDTYLVLLASGENFANGDKAIDVLALFKEKQPSLRLKEITGWDGIGLLHVTTLTEQGTKGPSFWFDIASRSFLQLY